MHPRRVAVCVCLALLPSLARSGAGTLQVATRPTDWGNDGQDSVMVLQHAYLSSASTYLDGDGAEVAIPRIAFDAYITRIVRPWHFGADGRYQLVVEADIPYYSIRQAGAPSASGLGDPSLYTSIGWNDASKTTHVQAALIVSAPFGGKDVSLTSNAYAVMPIVGFEQRLGDFMLDAAAGYWRNFEDRSEPGTRANDYLELNAAISYWRWIGGLYVQADYTKHRESRTAGAGNGDGGYHFLVAPGFRAYFRQNLSLDLRYDVDLEGRSTTKGRAATARLAWVF